jgi:tetratricopeptide (TPR) repeat protein/glycosyltransferase involved in cell wall biosynthesis
MLLKAIFDFREWQVLLAEGYLRTGRSDAAERVYRAVLARSPYQKSALTALGNLLLKLRRHDEAIVIWRRVIEISPNQSRPSLQLARALHRSGRIDEAAAQYQHVLALTPLPPYGSLKSHSKEPLLQMARISRRQQSNDEALGYFRKVLEHDPNHEEALFSYGQILAGRDPAAAIRHFSDWMERQPTSPTPQLELAQLYRQAGDTQRAETIVQGLLDHLPNDRNALARIARVLPKDSGHIDQALDLWRRIAERDPSAPSPLVQRAYLLEGARRPEEAESEYRRALKLAPMDAMALTGLARLLFKQARWNVAVTLYETLHRVNPQRGDALLGLGRCLEELDRDDEALAAYRKVLEIEPNNVNALLYSGRLLRQLNRIDEAIAAWTKICKQSPQTADAWHELVFMLASAERENEALAALDAAETALPASPQTWVRLGSAAEVAQLHHRAVAYFGRASAAEPKEAGHRARLGQHYLRQGILDAAFHHLLAARELKPADTKNAKQLVDVIHVLNLIGIDHRTLASAPSSEPVLIPERLFPHVREAAERVAPYQPVPRRIIAVTASLAAGGAERQLVNQLRGLSEPTLKLDISLFCISLARRTRRDFFRPLLADKPVEIVTPPDKSVEKLLLERHVAPYAQLIRSFPPDMTKLIAFWLGEFRRRRPQVVHAWQDSTNLTAVVAALLAGVPRIILGTRSVRPDNPRRRLKRFMQEGYRAVLDHPSVVLTNNSHAGAADYADWLDIAPSSIEVIHNGIDFEHLAATVDPERTIQFRRDLGIPEDAPVVGSVFRMSEEKRPILWIDMAAEVARREPRAHFVVCGEGPMFTEMRDRAAQLGISGQVHLPGRIDGIGSSYKAMDVVILTSRHEGLPNVLLEAQSLGVPVVAPDVGGVGETLWQGVTGWAVPHADARSLADHVLVCLQEDWKTRARREAPAFVRERFSVHAMLRHTLEVYDLSPPDTSP